MENSLKILFLDNDGVICLPSEWGSRYKKTKAYSYSNPGLDHNTPVEFRLDNFNKKAIKVLNEILEETGAEIVVSSDWRYRATLNELGEYYLSQGVLKKPIDITPKTNDIEMEYWDKYEELNRTLENERALEIKYWLLKHPEVSHWVAVDDLNMKMLENFVHTPRSNEGIKQSGVKEKIIKFLT